MEKGLYISMAEHRKQAVWIRRAIVEPKPAHAEQTIVGLAGWQAKHALQNQHRVRQP
jgi:hypothetical protein